MTNKLQCSHDRHKKTVMVEFAKKFTETRFGIKESGPLFFCPSSLCLSYYCQDLSKLQLKQKL